MKPLLTPWRKASSAIAETPAGRRPRVYLLLECGGGGSGRHVLDLYAGLVAAGWNVHLLLSSMRMDAGFAAEVASLPSTDVTFLRLRRSPHLSDLAEIRRIRKQLKLEGGAAVLHAHSTKAGIVAWALRGSAACRIFTPHAYRGMDPELKGYRAAAVRTAEKIFSHPFQSVIAVSQDEVGYARTLGVRPGRIHLITNGVHAAAIQQRVSSGKVSRVPGKRMLGFLGRLVEQKNPALFLRVVAECVRRGQDVHALIVGDGPLMPQLRQLARELQVEARVEWLGMVPALDVLKNMDVLVHTSAYESLPYALLEAVAANVPVVAVENAGSRAIFGELLPQCIAPAGTPAALAQAACNVLESDAVRAQYREAYTLIADRFSTQSMVEKTIIVYQDAWQAAAAQRHRQKAGWLLPQLHLPPRPGGVLRRAFWRGGPPLDAPPAAAQQSGAFQVTG